MTTTFDHHYLAKTSAAVRDVVRNGRFGLLQAFARWTNRRRQIRDLRQLLAMDNRMFSDIGVSWHQVQEEYLRLLTGRRLLKR